MKWLLAVMGFFAFVAAVGTRDQDGVFVRGLAFTAFVFLFGLAVYLHERRS
jgi:hypothetical protein